MNVTLRASNGLLALTDELGPATRRLHKYAVVEDHRRTGPMWGEHADSYDLSKIAVEHVQTVTIVHGRVGNVKWEPQPEAIAELVDRGATVVDDDRVVAGGVATV